MKSRKAAGDQVAQGRSRAQVGKFRIYRYALWSLGRRQAAMMRASRSSGIEARCSPPRNIDEEFLHPGPLPSRLKIAGVSTIRVRSSCRSGNSCGTRKTVRLSWSARRVSSRVQTPASGYEFSVTKRIGQIHFERGWNAGRRRVDRDDGQPAISYRIDNYDESPAKLEELLKDDVKAQHNRGRGVRHRDRESRLRSRSRL